ncbi:hypothetical protein ACYFX5_08315 [Bremerella sp. T1]|uniref:hypothetical protein n=1 Tax=Bremerella sp. TYQ1 TaxID=3119568 RepID=UPI001CCD834E|nr:hypothetical protein [Bremerella volcania]UBM38261.1 hypothetical protein LA756_10250 [Bremerella volcania]
MKFLKIAVLLLCFGLTVGCGSNVPTEIVTELTEEQKAEMKAHDEAVEADEAAQRQSSQKKK